MIDFKNATWRGKAARPCALALTVVRERAADEGLSHFDVARARQMIEMRRRCSSFCAIAIRGGEALSRSARGDRWDHRRLGGSR